MDQNFLDMGQFLVLSKLFGPDQNVLDMNFHEIFSYSVSENEKNNAL